MMLFTYGLFLVFFVVGICGLQKNYVDDEVGAMLYLSKYGYMARSSSNPKSAALISEESFRNSILEFQAFANLNMTGVLDNETIYMMNLPRCGVRDKVGFGSDARRKKRYALQGSRWRVKRLTYKITKYPLDLTEAEVDRVVSRAFKVWEAQTDLTFAPLEGNQKLHIEIRFEKGEHGDGDAFDGPGGTLAHAYFPIYGGDVHFDASETWSIGSYRGTNFFQVAAHEFGHSLGLSHSDNQGALMAAFYRGYQPNFKLHSDDKNAIQKLYGKKKTTTTDKPPTNDGGVETRTTSDSSLCSDPIVDAIVTMNDKETYVFKGNNYYQLTDNGIASGYPRPIKGDFDDLPGNLQAAFTWTNGKTYFFKGDEYWRFTDMVMDEAYPKKINKGFRGIPNDIDSAFVWSGNGKIYFTKGSLYWRFDPSQRPPVKETYPKPLSNWEGLPNNLDGALQYSNGYTYFFKDKVYYRFNDRGFKVDNAEPEFPRPTDYWWFGCKGKESYRSQGVNGAEDKVLPLPGVDDVYEDDGSYADGPDVEPSNEESKSAQMRDVKTDSSRSGSSATAWETMKYLKFCYCLIFYLLGIVLA